MQRVSMNLLPLSFYRGAMDGLVRHEVAQEDVEVAWVPGAFEIPLIAQKMAESGKYDAVICLVR